MAQYGTVSGLPPAHITRIGLYHLSQALPQLRTQRGAHSVYLVSVFDADPNNEEQPGRAIIDGPAHTVDALQEERNDIKVWPPSARLAAWRIMRDNAATEGTLNVILLVYTEDGIHCTTHAIGQTRAPANRIPPDIINDVLP